MRVFRLSFIAALLALAACSAAQVGSGTSSGTSGGTLGGTGAASTTASTGHASTSAATSTTSGSAATSLAAAATGSTTASSAASATGGSTSSTGTASTGVGASTGGSTTGSTSGSTTGGLAVLNPAVAGPYTYAEADDSTVSSLSGDTVPLHYAYPTAGPTTGPYPEIVIAPGFEIPASQYYVYAEWLAGFGYVAIVDAYPQSAFSPNHVHAAEDLMAALDWAATQNTTSGSALFGLVDTSHAGVSGHSLGGKLSILAASMDPRFKASLLLDPVDGSMDCSATNCPNAIDVLPLPIPIGFLGETLDSTGSFACAPAADNYATLYAAASSPSFEVTLLGAGHMSFVDSISGCGLVCEVCATPTAPQAQVISIAESYLVAFYELNFRGNTGYQTYLTGAQATALYVNTSEATIVSK